MSLDALYVLPESVRLMPVTDLEPLSKDRFSYEEDDYVVTYTHARNLSKVIDHSSATLLKEFRSPLSFAEAVFKYSLIHRLDPAETIDGAYQFLSGLRNEGYLIPYDNNHPSVNKDVFEPGEFFLGYEVITKLQGVSDTEVYELRKGDQHCALKILKTGGKSSPLSESFFNEIDILHRLDGKVNPLLIESGEHDHHHFILMEWCEGVSCDQLAAKYRNTADVRNLEKLLALSVRLLEAFAHLHGQGIIHSDIHSKNVIVGDEGTVKVIDYGLTRKAGPAGLNHRGGIGFFFEPEYATAVMEKRALPLSSFQGEQYALGALIYLLVTGKHYLHFSFEKDLLFRQIAEEPPVPFDRYDLDIEPRLEKAIFKALSKTPADRYASVAAFAGELSAIKTALSTASTASIASRYSISAFCEGIRDKFGWKGRFIHRGLQVAPTCSVNYGAAGIAYMYYRMACLEKDPGLLALADVWADRAADYIQDRERAFYSADRKIDANLIGDISPYHTAGGVSLVQALISKAMGDHNNHCRAIADFMYHASQPCENLDLTLGKSGILIGSSILYAAPPSIDAAPFAHDSSLQKELMAFGDLTLEQIWSSIREYAPIAEISPITFRGIAHGWAGILYATLLWCTKSGCPLPASFFERVEQLFLLTIEENDYARWPIGHGDKTSWSGWCHGSAGYTFLWTLLFQTTQDQKFLHVAEKASRHFMLEDNTGVNGSLCCGLAGEAYALLNLYKVTRHGSYLEKAKDLCWRILQNVYSPEMENNSLYKGDIGVAVLFSELDNPGQALMPLFEC